MRGAGVYGSRMAIRLDGDVALVTGTGKGIGEAIARRLAAAGARVACTARRLEDAQRLAAELGSEHRAYALDVADAASVEAAVAAVCADLGAPHLLVNNAGINRIGPTEALAEADWQAVVDTNLTGVFRCCRAVGPRMLAEGRGSIVNIASIFGTGVAAPWRAAYAASKAGVVGLTQELGVEWMGRGVRVNAILPGPVRTAMVQRFIDEGAVDEQGVIDRTPAGRFGEVADVADAVLLLATPESAFVTGQAIVVDGGYAQWGASQPASLHTDRCG